MKLVTNHWGWTPGGIWRWVRWGWGKPISTWGIVLDAGHFGRTRIVERRCKIGPVCFSLGVRRTPHRVVNG